MGESGEYRFTEEDLRARGIKPEDMGTPEQGAREQEITDPQRQALEELEQRVGVRNLRGVLYPEGGAIQAWAKAFVYGGERDPYVREEALARRGYSAAYLASRGKEIEKQLDDSFEDKNSMPRDQQYNFLRLVFSPGGLRHSSITVGLSAELSRQAKKLLAAVVARYERQATRVIESSDTVVNDDEIARYLRLARENPDELRRREEKLLDSITQAGASPEQKRAKQSQYRTAAELLHYFSNIGPRAESQQSQTE